MGIRTGLAALLVLALPGLLGAAPVQFTSPGAGASLTRMPVSVSLDFDESADELTLVVLLNGNDITGELTLAPPSGGRVVASAAHVWSGFVQLGANQLDATIDLAGQPQHASVSFDTIGDPYADGLGVYNQGTNGGFNAGALPGVVLGAPAGSGLFQGGLDVLSLGLGGSIEVEFSDNVIVDGPGADFAVFENAFLELGAGSITQPPFAEPGRVLVSQDGIEWLPFACDLVPGGAPYWPGCAGIYPVLSDGTLNTPHASVPTSVPIEDLVGVFILSLPLPAGAGGDRFDLADVGLAWARYVRIEAADFDTNVVGTGNSAFDLDAVAAIHSSPTVPAAVPAASTAGGVALVLLLLATAAVALRGGQAASLRGSTR